MSPTGQFRRIGSVRGESVVPPIAEISLHCSEIRVRAIFDQMHCIKTAALNASVLVVPCCALSADAMRCGGASRTRRTLIHSRPSSEASGCVFEGGVLTALGEAVGSEADEGSDVCGRFTETYALPQRSGHMAVSRPHGASDGARRDDVRLARNESAPSRRPQRARTLRHPQAVTRIIRPQARMRP
jgi:hypothetical protein